MPFFIYSNSFCSATEPQGHPKASRPSPPWCGAADLRLNRIMSDLRLIRDEILLGNIVTTEPILCSGFKEIRFLESLENFDEYIVFLRELFPDALFIVNRRVMKTSRKARFGQSDLVRRRLKT